MPKIMRCATESMFLEANAMEYETPEVRSLTPAINAIHQPKGDFGIPDYVVTDPPKELVGAYEDWE
jgi:hypothetical protein